MDTIRRWMMKEPLQNPHNNKQHCSVESRSPHHLCSADNHMTNHTGQKHSSKHSCIVSKPRSRAYWVAAQQHASVRSGIVHLRQSSSRMLDYPHKIVQPHNEDKTNMRKFKPCQVETIWFLVSETSEIVEMHKHCDTCDSYYITQMPGSPSAPITTSH